MGGTVTADGGSRQLPRRQRPLLLRPLAWVEGALLWLVSNPILTLQIVLFLLIAWGGLGAEAGLDDLFWHDDPWVQGLVGVSVSLLFGQILALLYFLQRHRTRWLAPWTLFPANDPAIRKLGRYLGLVWPLSLALLIVPKFLMLKPEQRAEQFLPLAIGAVGAMFVVSLLVMVFEKSGLRKWAQNRRLIRLLPGHAWGFSTDADIPLHGLALIFSVLFLVGLATVAVIHFLRFTVLTPFMVMCLIFATFNSVYGFLKWNLRGLNTLALAALILLAVATNSTLVDPAHAYKLSFPNMEVYYTTARQAAARPEAFDDDPTFVRLDEERWRDEQGKLHRKEHYQQMLKEPGHTVEAAGLIDSEEPLQAMCARWQEKHPGTKPRLVLVATSGGGIRAATWTAVVLEAMDEVFPQLREHIRIITGASGGMVGAGLYVTDFPRRHGPEDVDPRTGLGAFSRLLAKDSLSATVQTMLLSDVPGIWVPGPKSRDRGRELELAWYRNMRREGQERSPLEMSFAELREDERQARRPSLVYTPMFVEDSRRLYISNLDLDKLTENHGEQLGLSAKAGKVVQRPLRSLSAVEFFRLFPEAKDFRVSTAARMNASFPLVSPAVNLPTYPPRRVVDTGYYDNYGVNFATEWLFHNRKAVQDHTSGVLLLEIRASPNSYARRHFLDRPVPPALHDKNDDEEQPRTEPPPQGLVAQSIQWISTPAEALLTVNDRSSIYRGDELLQLLDLLLNRRGQAPFFTTVAFECTKDAALSWKLPDEDARNIVTSFWTDIDHKEMQRPVKRRVDQMKQWFGDGGK